MFPAYAMVQDNIAEFRQAFLRLLQRTALLALPLAIAMVIAAEPIVLGLLGETWEPVVTPLRIVAIFSLVRSFGGTAGAVFQAAGRPQLVPLFTLPQAITIVPALLILTPRYGVTGAALAMLIAFSLSGVPALFYAIRILEIRPRVLAGALAPFAACAAAPPPHSGSLVHATEPLPPVGALAVTAAAACDHLAAAATLARRRALRTDCGRQLPQRSRSRARRDSAGRFVTIDGSSSRIQMPSRSGGFPRTGPAIPGTSKMTRLRIEKSTTVR